MATYGLHCFGESGNSFKVAAFLNCAGLDWEVIPVDFFNGQSRDPTWRESVNPMGEVPVLDIDDERLTQTGVMLTELAKTTGQFAPDADDASQREALRWLLFDNHKFTSYFATHRFLYALVPGGADPAVLAFLRGRAEAALAIVDKHLAKKPFMLGERPTYVDFSLCGYMFYPTQEHGFDFKSDFANLEAWRQRMAALPGWKGPYELMPRAMNAPA
ncbi:MAG: glutathione S-transferase family protein [Pseudomonadota bacterium]